MASDAKPKQRKRRKQAPKPKRKPQAQAPVRGSPLARIREDDNDDNIRDERQWMD